MATKLGSPAPAVAVAGTDAAGADATGTESVRWLQPTLAAANTNTTIDTKSCLVFDITLTPNRRFVDALDTPSLVPAALCRVESKHAASKR